MIVYIGFQTGHNLGGAQAEKNLLSPESSGKFSIAVNSFPRYCLNQGRLLLTRPECKMALTQAIIFPSDQSICSPKSCITSLKSPVPRKVLCSLLSVRELIFTKAGWISSRYAKQHAIQTEELFASGIFCITFSDFS